MIRWLRDAAGNRDGGVMLIFALSLPILLAVSAAALEYGSIVKRRGELQRAADSGSIAGVNQFKLANADDASSVQVAIATAQTQAAVQATAGATLQAAAQVLGNHSSVQVTLTETVPLAMGKLLAMSEMTIKVQSTAKLSGTTRLCLLALDPAARGAFHLESSARITAGDCSLYSNSRHASGIEGESNAVARALSTCSAGGYTGNKASFMPPPATDCPVLKDPLADRAGPPLGLCKILPLWYNPKMLFDGIDSPLYGTQVVSTTATLEPGTYCGGLHITKGAKVTLKPGIYIMSGGPLVVDKKSSFTGTNTGFYFTGLRAGLLFDEDSVISLTAPKDGIMAGLLFFEDRALINLVPLPPPLSGKGPAPSLLGAVVGLREYRIISNEARNLLGTIYLPAGRLIIDSKKPIADQSAYTVIIARMINLYDGPDLVLNARYGTTDIPVPEGVGPSSADTVLSH
ncbi:TadE/TadG family type IV pilus assembly protein [Methylobacterium sp. Leaf399]|uniref:TadE/TadG family type IV pilus assembly protein n=1 Tax=Methylobacterium sp. Leaf399 TaxID=1736364 RepID=UPI0006F3FBF8|nr:pilus assembly protein TadG-related protein [Methylobacterium sp. Leaf399]